MKALTIVVPTFNSSLHIRDCLDSIIEVLKYRLELFEVIVKDGGSTDDTVKIIESFQNNLHLLLINEKDSGVFNAMNQAILKSTGKWLYFLGADDKLHSEFIHVFDNIENTGADLMYGNIQVNGEKRSQNIGLPEILFSSLCHQGIIYRRDLFIKYGLFNEKFKISADTERNIYFFSKEEIQVKYIDHIFAEFALGGLSDKFEDCEFRKAKPALIKEYYKEKFDEETLRMLVEKSVRRNAIKLIDDGRCFALGLKMYFRSIRDKGLKFSDFRYILGSIKNQVFKRTQT